MMRLLLDESLPVDLRNHLPHHQVETVSGMGWSGTSNGMLLARASKRFDALITADKNIRYQQNPASLPLSVVVLSVKKNILPEFLPLLGKLDAVLADLPAHSFSVID
jgi:predicted nuclease of predicted toxin-antitoxin system